MKFEHVEMTIRRITEELKARQSSDGSWNFPFETGTSTDAYMIILLRTLEINDEDLIRELTQRLLSRQEKNGAWKLYYDEGDGNLTATVEAYYALLYSTYYSTSDPQMRAAKKFIVKNGGIQKSHMFTKIMLALTGQYQWPAFFPIPVELILLPLSFPIHFYDISVFGRANLAPIMILATKKYSKKTKYSPDLSHLFTSRSSDFYSNEELRKLKTIADYMEKAVKYLIGLPFQLRQSAIERTKQYMLTHIEPDGTLNSYFSATFLMIFALLSLGSRKDAPLITKAIDGLKRMRCTIKGHTHMQYTTANVWNTSLISFAMQSAGISPSDPAIQKANRYLLEKQHIKFGDWAIRNSGVMPGGWGFSDINTFNPDVDDTTASLRALSATVQSATIRESWNRGVSWSLSMQNRDGGWPAFEKNIDKKIWNLLPIEGNKFLISDASSADLTGRTLEFLGHYTNLPKKHRIVKNGTNWLLTNQRKDGTWYGRWGICYIYGTWAAMTGLLAAGINPEEKHIQKALHWLKHIQNEDGGWGESCHSDQKNQYIPLGASNITQTSWALDSLIAAEAKPSREINFGIDYLLQKYDQKDWTDDYPVGQGMGGAFYIHYHSYRYIFPLISLTNYVKKYKNQ
ncbi:sporulenol synthase [Bacillus thermophilus]|uniref:Sporulenol synthase n=2 Tax=Siminovitchia thermophila TaxID=1245522 RepID=A0ABS2RBD6_9BACI|nr:sporulenol synthase [Siminovitchia thermophila]